MVIWTINWPCDGCSTHRHLEVLEIHPDLSFWSRLEAKDTKKLIEILRRLHINVSEINPLKHCETSPAILIIAIWLCTRPTKSMITYGCEVTSFPPVTMPVEGLELKHLQIQGRLSLSPGIILCMHRANERWRCIVTSSRIGWVHTQRDPWSLVNIRDW